VVPGRRQLVHLRATCTVWSCLHHMGAICTIWNADGTIWEPLALCGGNMGASIGCMGAKCAIWEPHVPYGSNVASVCVYERWMAPHLGHRHHVGAIWELYAHYGSHVQCTGAMWYHLRGRWCHLGLLYGAWEPQAPCGSHMHHVGSTCTIWRPNGSHVCTMGGRGPRMGAVCRLWEPCAVDGTVLEPHVLYGSHIHHMGADTPCVRRMASYRGRM
jgi:hypothetical protein